MRCSRPKHSLQILLMRLMPSAMSAISPPIPSRAPTNTGLILGVEPGEAEWLLDVLEALFDFYFVRPARLTAKRDALNKKLAEAGKPPMKEGSP